jgi:hypothetical protein
MGLHFLHHPEGAFGPIFSDAAELSLARRIGAHYDPDGYDATNHSDAGAAWEGGEMKARARR